MSLTIGPWLQPLPLPERWISKIHVFFLRDIPNPRYPKIPPKKVSFDVFFWCVCACEVQIYLLRRCLDVQGNLKFMYGTLQVRLFGRT